jgi:hypothetical protein
MDNLSDEAKVITLKHKVVAVIYGLLPDEKKDT